MMNILGIIVSFAYVFLILFLGRFVERRSKELSRKFVHIMVSNWWFIGMIFFNSPWVASIVPAAFIVLNALSYRKNLFTAMERGEGKGDLGTVYYAISLCILSFLTLGRTPKEAIIGGAGFLVMGYGDGLAAVVGTSVKSKKLLGTNKSLAGSLTMLGASFIVLLLFLLAGGLANAVLVSLLVAIAATLAELITPWGFDNLTVPLLVSGLLALVY